MDLSESILSAASYHCEDFGRSVIQIEDRHFDMVRYSVFKHVSECPDSGLGALDVLPVEILSSICLMLDVDAGFRFSQVSRRARAIVASVPEYLHLGDHALKCLCALLRTDIGHHVAISTLHSALLNHDCESCGFFAGYLFLPTLTRCCFRCIESAKGLSAAPLEKLASESGMSTEQLKEVIPVFHTLPTLQNTATAMRGGRRFLVAEEHCIEILRSIGNPEPMPTYFSSMHLPGFGWEASTTLPSFNPKTGEVQTGVSCKGCQVAMKISPSEQAFKLRQRVYSRQKFLDHFQQCSHARKIWESSQRVLNIRP
ncbi:F-box domain-containing protein [Dactylonectria macrodidyma]|uniref:F-box domain-containing protein n=1 Tax=Dactylonectria macrodidyma TaxID=307937 RepID=A0A9P9FMD9_9HYPO|nr:F-box domain-containing protein [Dactylonectria macrodidyma]